MGVRFLREYIYMLEFARNGSMSDKQLKKALYIYRALKDGWQVQMIAGKTSNQFELTKPLELQSSPGVGRNASKEKRRAVRCHGKLPQHRTKKL